MTNSENMDIGLKSLGGPPPCRFKSGPRHHWYLKMGAFRSSYFFTPAAEGRGLWPWMNASRRQSGDVAPLGREVSPTGFARGAPQKDWVWRWYESSTGLWLKSHRLNFRTTLNLLCQSSPNITVIWAGPSGIKKEYWHVYGSHLKQ